MPYRYDPDVRTLVAELLYHHLPELYRTRDMPHPGAALVSGGESEGPLRRFLDVLGAPLAVVRQNVEELHADLFIDTSADWTIAYLAEMVGTTLVFPDAPANRRDVRGTVGWRRRKGTPRTLETMAAELTGELVVTHEGWKRLLVSQDLNLLRPARTIPDLRPAIIAETVSGPLDRAFHVVDPRLPMSEVHGRYHPRHVVHWRHPTQLFPLRRASARDLTAIGDPDFRYAFHPLGRDYPMRLSRTAVTEQVATDLVLPMHFDESPGGYFGPRGGFVVHVCGVAAAVAEPSDEPRTGRPAPADAAILAGVATVTLLERPPHGQTDPVNIELCAVPRQGAAPLLPDVSGAVVRGGTRVDAGGGAPVAGLATAVVNAVAMLRVRPTAPATSAWFPGAVVEVVSSDPAGRLESTDTALAVEGFLRGAVVVRVPAMWVRGDRWLYLAADGSVHESQGAGQGPVDVPLEEDTGVEAMPGQPLAPGPGAAWPPLAASAVAEPFLRVPCAPGRGPVVLHGGAALDVGSAVVGAGTQLALAWAVRRVNAGVVEYEPFLRLGWTGPDSSAATWTALDDTGTPTAALAARFQDVAELREEGGDFHLVVRLESDTADVRLPPCEVAFTGDDGQVVLVHLPTLQAHAGTPVPAWPTSLAAAGTAVAVAGDGSTTVDGSTQTARYSLGAVAPLREYATLRRRRVRYRRLCSWRNEAGPSVTPPTPAGFLDVDPEFGLFSLAASEPAQEWPPPPGGPPAPDAVTVDYQMGYTNHTGSLPAPREPELDERLPAPTRLVSGSSAFSAGATASRHATPRYRTLTEALQAIATDAAAGTGADHEVVQFEDSATYAEHPEWPTGPARLTIQAAESTRPTLVLAGWDPLAAGSYQELTVRGLAWGGSTVVLPATDRATVQFCTVTDPASPLQVASVPGGATELAVRWCVTAAIVTTGPVDLQVADTVIDTLGVAGGALSAAEGTCQLDRVTILGDTAVRQLDASEVLFDGDVEVLDRFRGCVRYSRVPVGATLPRKHRVVEGVKVAFVSVDRDHPAHARLSDLTDQAVRRGAEDGSEMGAFHDRRFAQQGEALATRLAEFTPVGLDTGIVIRP